MPAVDRTASGPSAWSTAHPSPGSAAPDSAGQMVAHESQRLGLQDPTATPPGGAAAAGPPLKPAAAPLTSTATGRRQGPAGCHSSGSDSLGTAAASTPTEQRQLQAPPPPAPAPPPAAALRRARDSGPRVGWASRARPGLASRVRPSAEEERGQARHDAARVPPADAQVQQVLLPQQPQPLPRRPPRPAPPLPQRPLGSP